MVSRHSGEVKSRAIEWPTVAVAMATYVAWMVVTYWHDNIPTLLLIVIGGWILAWQGSLQHETIHGHPTGLRTVDTMIGFPPLSLWLPYALYCRSHTAHHASRPITDPVVDPESRYVQERHSLAWAAARAQSTLIGHMVLGPPIAVVRLIAQEVTRTFVEPRQVVRDWMPHLIAVGGLLLWLDHVGLSFGAYVAYFVYPGMVLTTLRSHAEHRADLSTDNRAASIESRGPLALLFLNNNFHAAHHEQPGLAWYRLPSYHFEHRNRLLADHSALYSGYSEVIRRFAVHAHDAPVHPAYRGATGFAEGRI